MSENLNGALPTLEKWSKEFERPGEQAWGKDRAREMFLEMQEQIYRLNAKIDASQAEYEYLMRTGSNE